VNNLWALAPGRSRHWLRAAQKLYPSKSAASRLGANGFRVSPILQHFREPRSIRRHRR